MHRRRDRGPRDRHGRDHGRRGHRGRGLHGRHGHHDRGHRDRRGTAGMAAAAGMPVWLQVVGLGLGVSGAYGTHVHATIANATIPSDSLHFTREDDLIGGALMPVDGYVTVPDTPGLGVELDMEAVDKYRVG